MLNLFGYTGGFSVYAGLAGASAVTTVDVADAALAAADANWALNGLKASKHEAVTMDAFEFLERAHSGGLWACQPWQLQRGGTRQQERCSAIWHICCLPSTAMLSAECLRWTGPRRHLQDSITAYVVIICDSVTWMCVVCAACTLFFTGCCVQPRRLGTW